MVHRENVEYFNEHEPRKLRKYLMDMQDEALLTYFDKANMKSGTA